MDYKFFAQIDPGRVRTNNEDAVALDEASRVGVLADGMGGYNAGEVASAMATTMVKAELVEWLASRAQAPSAEQLASAIRDVVDRVHHAIMNAAEADPACAGMGTTLVVGVFRRGSLTLGHIGDSRCYRFRHKALRQLTRDHSLLQERIDAGLMTVAQAAHAPGRNLLTRALGIRGPLAIEIHEHAVEEGDLYLMCSDGLTGMLSDQTIERILATGAPLEQVGDSLIKQANARGGRDNIAVLLAQALPGAGRPTLVARLFGRSHDHEADEE